MISFCLAVILYLSSLVTCEKDSEKWKNAEVVGFWNLYAEGPFYQQIVEKQIEVIIMSGLQSRINKIYYATMGKEGASFKIDDDKFEHLIHFGDSGAETQTLNEVYKYCHDHKYSKVLYFHNKGSLNFNPNNDHFRKALDCFVLNTHCISALDIYDTCGWRISPVPHIHYSGNYWWARCTHINKLIDPLSYQNNQTFLDVTQTLYEGHKYQPTPTDRFPDYADLGLGRYFAETWLGSLPWFIPSDCMNASVNNRYLYSYGPLPWRMVNKRCANFRRRFQQNARLSSKHMYKFGLPCSDPGTMADPKRMKKRHNLSSANYTEKLEKRSLLWYGQIPELQKKWLQLYDGIEFENIYG